MGVATNKAVAAAVSLLQRPKKLFVCFIFLILVPLRDPECRKLCCSYRGFNEKQQAQFAAAVAARAAAVLLLLLQQLN